MCDDTIGKKCVFRNGWDRNSSYLLLNYRDEPATNEIYHKNLTLTIPVKAEKTHHGHNDENALCMLIAQERILLAEGGYRKGAERDCTYRSDYYHNKLIVRKGVTKAYSFFEHVLDFGEYNPVRTERIYFYRFDEVDCSRTRLYDARNAAVCDRIILLPEERRLLYCQRRRLARKKMAVTRSDPSTTHNVSNPLVAAVTR